MKNLQTVLLFIALPVFIFGILNNNFNWVSWPFLLPLGFVLIALYFLVRGMANMNRSKK